MSGGPETIDEVRQSFDAAWSVSYRLGDEDVVRTSDTFKHYGTVLRELTASLPEDSQVLDVGCGSGRYFHCVRNVGHLVGIDLSRHMLEQARNPVRANEVSAVNIELICGELLSTSLPESAFDVIYSIGVYGEYSPFDDALLRRFSQLLKPGGVLFITAVDSGSRIAVPESGTPSLVRRLAIKVFPLLPRVVRERINRVLSPHYVSRREVEAVFARSPFQACSIEPYKHVSGWRGTHWDCRAIR